MDTPTIQGYIDGMFETEYMPALEEFVRIESLSPIFDPDWQTNKNLDKQCAHLVKFVESQKLQGVSMHILNEEGRTPFLIVKVDAFNAPNSQETVLMYGHMDKQPYGDGWTTGPADPVRKDGRLYGRGSADDGYALLTAVTAVKACQMAGKTHPKIVITIEGSEEGEIHDLIHYLKTYKHLLDEPTLVVCLDAGAISEDTITITSTLRGCITFDVTVKVADNNCHSGVGGGIMPNPYNIMNCVLMRVQDYKTQEVIEELQLEKIPDYRLNELKVLGESQDHLTDGLPMFDQTKSIAYLENSADKKAENVQLFKNNSWRTQLAVIGIEGLPSDLSAAGNAIYKGIKFRCSMRIPPHLKNEKVCQILKEKITAPGNETFGAQIGFEVIDGNDGFDAPDLPENIKTGLHKAIDQVFGEGTKPLYVGCGGSIPFMEVFAQEFPKANFMLTGLGFADSNMHSANENLRINFCKKLTQSVGILLSEI